MKAIVQSRPWKHDTPPGKILVMRFQALGDTIITLPYLQSLKRQYPDIELHFLTRQEVSSIPEHTLLFTKVIAIGGGRNAKLQLLLVLLKLPWLWWQGYDAVIDLQNHKISKIVRRLLSPQAWVEFDRTSPLSAGERTKQTIEALWKWKIRIDPHITLASTHDYPNDERFKNDRPLILLNPAGYCQSRSWPLEYYVKFAQLWLRDVNASSQFLLLLLPSHQEKADYLEKMLGDACINLTGKANQLEAYAYIKKCSLMLSEDSGLMHMAWTQGVPTVALFSSSRKDWAAPQGEWSYCFDSSDMACGPCMQEVCQFHDNRCLTRYTPEIVLAKARELYERN